MGRARAFVWATFALSLVFALALWWRWSEQSVPAGTLRLTRVGFSALPGWADSDARGSLAAFRRSCDAILKLAHAPMGGVGYAGTSDDWRAVCKTASSVTDAHYFFEAWFTPFSLEAGGDSSGLFTGYYEPEIHGSKTRHDNYTIAVFGRPSDLVSVDLGLFRDVLKGERIAGRVEGNKLVPYATRTEIDKNGVPNAPILFYANDPIDVFFLQIQGSGHVMFDDGTQARVVYAGGNGRPYTAIGRVLIARGALTKENLSMQTVRDWLVRNPQDAQSVMEQNQSFVFFALEPLGDATLGSKGTEGVALTPEASLAIDPGIHAFGAPLFLASSDLKRLVIAQDSGGAIRGAVRGDFYWGFGMQAADKASRMKSDGQFFVLLPKALADRIGEQKDFKLPP
ncbi:MAG TPA: murein transglycosylase A [Rhizomicrobium sp.]|jgi:membrane-bound lytic murein transglycosylase A|nr:murein transglycosylase A [Rhizomicrobium sp.]